ncbi:hypothetical protein BC940DRAFT_291337 [Gongronella butleri]|nr:hypothetical protein BC940DRAFT_291337 [Gongronella butleri]
MLSLAKAFGRLHIQAQGKRCLSSAVTQAVRQTQKNHLEQTRSRREWTAADTEKLEDAVQMHGLAYSYIAKRYFPERAVVTIYSRCKMLFDQSVTRGPWENDESEALRKLTEGKPADQIQWDTIQAQLPRPRTLTDIRMRWFHSVNPRFNRGRWSDEEKAKFTSILSTPMLQHGNWQQVSALMGTRSPRQCLERFRWQVAPTVKGKFTKEEDLAILGAVREFGDADFLKIKTAINSPRSSRHLSHHYRYKLDPAYDRSEWNDEEVKSVYNAYQRLKSMQKVREELNSLRHPKDLWNHYRMEVMRRERLRRKQLGIVTPRRGRRKVEQVEQE